MKKREKKYFFLGGVATLIFLVFISIIILLSEPLLKYSGIMTFLSLLAIFFVYALSEYSKNMEEEKDMQNLLRSILRTSDQITKDIKYYLDSFSRRQVPPTTMGSFDMEGLPLEIRSYSTKRLEDQIIFANSKIETINNWKEDYFEIVMEYDKKIMGKRYKRFEEVWGDTANNAIQELQNSIDEIKSELSKWIKVEL